MMQKITEEQGDMKTKPFDVSFKVLAEMSPSGIHVTDKAGKCLYVNPSWCRMASLTPELAFGDGWIKAIHKEDRNRFFSEWESFMQGETPWESEYRFIDANGKITWVYGTATLLKGSNGLIENILGITIDITERKNCEIKIKESKEKLRHASDTSGFGTFSYEFENGKAYYSKEFFDLYGLTPGETLEVAHDLVPVAIYPDDRKGFRSAMLKANDPLGSGILDIEFRIIRKDGSECWLRTRGLTTFTLNDITDRPLRATGIVQDITERKKSERELYEFGEKYRLLLENSGLGIGYYDTNGKILMFNKEALRNMGGSEDDFIGKNLTDVFGKDKGDFFIRRLKKAALSDIPLQFEDKVDLEGNPGWYLSTHMRIMNKNGEVEGIQVIANNITKSKIADEKVRESEAEYRSLFENSIMGISQTYPDGGYKRINKAYANMYGYPDIDTMLTEVSGNTTKLFSDPDNRTKVIETIEKEGYMAPNEFELIRRNGEKFWALVSAKQVKDDTGKLLYLQAEHIDITSRKKLQKEMYSSSLYSRNLIEASLDPLVTISAEGKITDVNLATENATGISRERLIGSDFADYFENPGKAKTGYKTVFSKGTVKDFPLTLIHESGRKTDVLYNASLFKNENGEVQGVFAAARDITELKKIEEELRKSKELLEKLNQHLIEVRENERNEIALNLHDDLGQKLTAINLDIAWLKSRMGVQAKPVREKIEEMSSMIKETIESIKQTSALLRPAILFDLGLVPAIKSLLNSFEKQTGIKCKFYFRPEEFLLEDRLSLILYRIVQESMTNIARHSGASNADTNLYVLKNKIKLIIEDNGSGIEKNKVNSFKSLGLAGIKERVNSVNGKMNIVGAPGSGTRISVEIPLPKVKTND